MLGIIDYYHYSYRVDNLIKNASGIVANLLTILYTLYLLVHSLVFSNFRLYIYMQIYKQILHSQGESRPSRSIVVRLLAPVRFSWRHFPFQCPHSSSYKKGFITTLIPFFHISYYSFPILCGIDEIPVPKNILLYFDL